MSKRDYERLPIEEFGRHLITTGDLDPIYIALHNMAIGPRQRYRWLLAYWCWYHAGVASYLSELEGMEFHAGMLDAARNVDAPHEFERWPRGHERRHARGDSAVKMVTALRERYKQSPENMVRLLVSHSGKGIVYKDLVPKVKSHYLFGDWIAFKVGDMLERVCGVNIDFDQAAVFMFRDPMKAAEMLYRDRHNVAPNATVKMDRVVGPIVEYLRAEFADLKAPPKHDRPISLQEIETTLCKHKSHMNGHYPLFNDIDEIRAGLVGWGETADKFLAAMPEGSS